MAQSKADYALRAKARRILTLREQGKAAYVEADELLDELLATVKPGQAIDLGKGKRAALVDQFAKSNKVWRSHATMRYALELIEG